MSQNTKQNNQLFRQQALEELSSPEQLDQVVQVVNPRAWIPLTAIGVLITATAIWGFMGRLPLKVSGQGVLMRPKEVVPVEGSGRGKILTLNVQPTQPVQKGQVIGNLDQSSIKQQLQQAQARLQRLQNQTEQTETLEEQQVRLQRTVIEQQRAALKSNLSTLEELNPIIREQGLKTIQENRRSLQVRLDQLQELLPNLKERVDSLRRLSEEKAIRRDRFLQAQREYFQSLAQISDAETQLRELDLKETQTQRQYLDNLNRIKEIQAQLGDLARQEKELEQQRQRTDFDSENKIENVREKIAQLQLELETQGKITSPDQGKLLEWSVVEGEMIQPGQRVASLEVEDDEGKLLTLAYFPSEDGKKISAGMKAQVTPTTVKRERYGGIMGEVVSVSRFPVTTEQITSDLGNQELARNFTRNRAPLQVTIKLQSRTEGKEGYQWTSSDGPPQPITSGTTATVQVRVGEIAPVAYVIPLFRSWTGIY
ncbi:secretion protein HlyD family protein [Halothece sp. PCC 7418]|uniref:NHLP bacteriocin system secretion protein n=1 Tax=Halothece sp. (strain PCC 7418) TaxID=65093 RepID=UPI0002A064EF|nr:NHLP bacteriocin system secretion protein [Halothece sp. PCC 7418]AFZ42442.1 secretion protein HlyD family protein [Halothece sp. PCC 7418]